MRDLTYTELDAELAEQLPARELMGRYGSVRNTAIAGNFQYGLINLGNTQVNVLSAFNSNGNYAAAG
jgi:hypothetical protein